MHPVIDHLLVSAGGAISRKALVQRVGRAAVDSELRSGRLVVLLPEIYGRPWSLDDRAKLQIAALRYAAPDGLLSHTSALERYQLWTPAPDEPIQLTVPAHRMHRSRALVGGTSLKVHRTTDTLDRDLSSGLPCVALPVALIQSWAGGERAKHRAPLITAARRDRHTVTAVQEEMAGRRRVADRESLNALLGLLAAGCESELEIWGYRTVFRGEEFSAGRWQYPVRAPGRLFRIDLAFPTARLAVELDGRGFHSSDTDWERDIARDVALARLGWQTIRFSHSRLTRDPDGCRRDVLVVLRARQTV
jgi:REase_MTES_1575